jgi:UDPglucose 6-dehydrogenase
MEHAEVRAYDADSRRSTHSLQAVLECDVVFVCLPTPALPSGACDLSAVRSFFKKQVGSQRVFVLRSTVPIGTTAALACDYSLPNIVHSPEFLTARCAVTDAQLPARNIIGYLRESPRGYDTLYELYMRRFPGIAVHVMLSNESEAVKLFLNGFFAVKVAYFNEVNGLAQKFGLNWDAVLKGMLSDGRVAHSHTRVPGPDGSYGFGGACLPKDLDSLIQQLGQDSFVTAAAKARNIKDRAR